MQMGPKRPRISLPDSEDHLDRWPCASEVLLMAEGNRTPRKGLPLMTEEVITMEMAGQEY